MRFSEIVFLIEKSLEGSEMPPGKLSKVLDAKTGKAMSRQDLFLYKVKNKSAFQKLDGSMVIIDPREAKQVKAWIATGPSGNITMKTVDGGSVNTRDLLKTEEFGGQGLATAQEGKVSNKGDIAEGILGAALFAKLSARVNGSIEYIGSDDVWKIVDAVKQSAANEYSVTIKDASQQVVNDRIVYTLKLNPAPYNDLMNPEKRSLLDGIAQSAVEYVNSEDGQKFSEYYYLNGIPDEIRVISDGVSGQKKQKTDVRVVAKDPETGEMREMQLNMSVKAGGVEQFGQVGGGDVRKKGDVFRAQKALWSHFGIDVAPLEDEFEKVLDSEGVLAAIAFMYMHAQSIFSELLSGDYDDEEYIYTKQFAQAINYFATLNDPNVVMISLDKGTYDVLNFNRVEGKLKDIDLDCLFRETTSLPQIEIFDKNSGKRLLKIRLYKSGKGTLKNLIEKGPLLVELASVKRKS